MTIAAGVALTMWVGAGVAMGLTMLGTIVWFGSAIIYANIFDRK